MTAPRIPASIRNCNPGAMWPGPSAKRFGATAFEWLVVGKRRDKIATFPDGVAGAAALFDLLCHGRMDGRYLYRDKSLADAIATWSGALHVETYLAVLKKRTGIDRDVVLDVTFLRDPQRAVPLAMAMAHQEAGRAFPLGLNEWRAAHNRALDFMPEPVVDAPFELEVDASQYGVPVEDAVAETAAASDQIWTPDNEIPSPRPESRVATEARSSRKWSLIAKSRAILASLGIGTVGISTADAVDAAPGLVATLKTVAVDNIFIVVVIALLLAILAVEIFRVCMRDDIASGRYTPSRS